MPNVLTPEAANEGGGLLCLVSSWWSSGTSINQVHNQTLMEHFEQKMCVKTFVFRYMFELGLSLVLTKSAACCYLHVVIYMSLPDLQRPPYVSSCFDVNYLSI